MYCVYDHWEEADQIVLERKAAGNTAKEKAVVKRKFAMLHDSWWVRRYQLQCAADTVDSNKVYQALKEICSPTQRKAICLPMPEPPRLQKTPRKPFRYASRPSSTKTEMSTWILSGRASLKSPFPEKYVRQWSQIRNVSLQGKTGL